LKDERRGRERRSREIEREEKGGKEIGIKKK
jgi:hypothetical protein